MATENIERKRAAVAYLKESGIPKCIENLLNNVVDDRPDDLYGYMAEYFAGLAKPPCIANVAASEIFSKNGYASFHVKIKSLIHGIVQDLSTFSAPFDTKPPVETKPLKGKTPVPVTESKPRGLMENDQASKIDEVQSLISNINSDIKSALVGRELYEQRGIDNILQNIIAKRVENRTSSVTQNETKPEDDENKPEHDESLPNDEHGEEPILTSQAQHLDTLTVSMAVAISASKLLKQSLHHYLYESVNNKQSSMVGGHVCENALYWKPSSFSLPTPMITVLGSGKKTPGKLYVIKDVLIFAKQDMVSQQALKLLTRIYQELEAIVMQKSPPNILGENGCFTPAMDRPEQTLDLIREAVVAAGYAHDSDVNVVLRCCSSDVYDKDKQKYEISTGVFKLSDELINLYEDLCGRYPELKVIIDPLLPEDSEGRQKLHEKIGDKCFIMNSFLNTPDPSKNIENYTPGMTIRVQDSPTVSQFFEQANTIKDEGKILVISPNDLGNHEECFVDMAVATGADFIILEAPTHLEHTTKYNRLVAIEEHLVASQTFLKKGELLPTIFHEPTPEVPEDEVQNEDTTT